MIEAAADDDGAAVMREPFLPLPALLMRAALTSLSKAITASTLGSPLGAVRKSSRREATCWSREADRAAASSLCF